MIDGNLIASIISSNHILSYLILSYHHQSLTAHVPTVAADESLYLKAIFSDNGSFDLHYAPQHESEKGDDAIKEGGDTVIAVSPLGSSTLSPSSPLPRVVGWETNERCVSNLSEIFFLFSSLPHPSLTPLPSGASPVLGLLI